MQVLKTLKNIELGEPHCFPPSKALRKSLETASGPIGGGMMVSELQTGINFVRHQEKWPKWMRSVFFFASLEGNTLCCAVGLVWRCPCSGAACVPITIPAQQLFGVGVFLLTVVRMFTELRIRPEPGDVQHCADGVKRLWMCVAPPTGSVSCQSQRGLPNPW